MNITIWDLDWFYKKSSIPNYSCMQLSSYHKQKGDKINFVTQETHLTLAYDILYIAKEKDETPLPSRKFIDDSRTKLIGQGFKYLGAKTLNGVVAACRPDYLLYETAERDQYANANFISFYAGTKLITKRQDFHNTKSHRKKTVVVDKYFWKATDQEIIFCLEELKQEKNIAFLEPISLQKLLSNIEIQQKFLELNFSTGTVFKWKNDYSSEFNKTKDIIDFLLKLKQVTKSQIGFIPIKAILLEHNNLNNINLDLLRCFQIIHNFKINKLNCIIIPPKNPLISPWFLTFKQLEDWTRSYIKLSYVEYILHFPCIKEGMVWYELLSNPVKWKEQKIDILLFLLTSNTWEDNIDLLFTQWGYEVLNKNKINRQEIKKNINLYYKDDKNE